MFNYEISRRPPLTLFLLFFTIINAVENQVKRDRYLVMFKKYQPSHIHITYLKGVAKEYAINFQIRKNSYTLGCQNPIPTDFVLVSFQNFADLGSLQKLIATGLLSEVKGLYLDSKRERKTLRDNSRATFLPLKPIEKAKKYEYRFSVNVAEAFNIKQIRSVRNTTGKGVKVGIFDTGISDTYKAKHETRIKLLNNWTEEKYIASDFNGHGTFVASIFVNDDGQCEGITPDADLYIFKVFTKSEESQTSWFLDAFNYAIHLKLDIINFSIGSTDFTDKPFVDKIKEVVANNITLVSAAGNDGPFFGTINNPADQLEVIAIGGYDGEEETVATYSSRGPTTWELVEGNGRVKPDLITQSNYILGSDIDGKCQTKSGTSVAAPIVSASIALLISYIRELDSSFIALNPASIRQALLFSANSTLEATIFEQGAGLFQIDRFFEYFDYPRQPVTVFPPFVNLSTRNDYFKPLSNQPLYPDAVPTVLNLTVINSKGDGLRLARHEWISIKNTSKISIDIRPCQERASIYFSCLGVLISVRHWSSMETEDSNENAKLDSMPKVVEGTLKVFFIGKNSTLITAIVEIPFIFDVIKTPPRKRRVIWDQFHNLKYPEASYIPRDSLSNFDYPYEWHGDHPYTNFIHLFDKIVEKGFFLEILREPFSCFEASKYGTLMIFDTEDSFSKEEIFKLQRDVLLEGLNIFVVGEWFDLQILERSLFYSMSKAQNITPVTAGANIPALNELLSGFGVAFGDRNVYSGDLELLNQTISYFSGSYISDFPEDGILISFDLFNESEIVISGKKRKGSLSKPVPIFGIVENFYKIKTSGRGIFLGDSNCLDSSYLVNDCFCLLEDILNYLDGGGLAILEEFENYRLPFRFKLNETAFGLKETMTPNFLDYSKTKAAGSEQCPFSKIAAKPVILDFDIPTKSNQNKLTLDQWRSIKKEKPLWSTSRRISIDEENVEKWIKFGIYVLAIVIFIGLLMNYRRKILKHQYQRLSTGDPIMMA